MRNETINVRWMTVDELINVWNEDMESTCVLTMNPDGFVSISRVNSGEYFRLREFNGNAVNGEALSDINGNNIEINSIRDEGLVFYNTYEHEIGLSYRMKSVTLVALIDNEILWKLLVFNL